MAICENCGKDFDPVDLWSECLTCFPRGHYRCEHKKSHSGGWYGLTKTLFKFLWWSYVECDYCKRRFWVVTSRWVRFCATPSGQI